MPLLAYKPTAEDVMARLRELYARRAGDSIFATMAVPNAALDAFAKHYGDGFCEYPDPQERIEFWDRYYGQRAVVEDDAIPAAYPSEMDEGLYTGVLGANVQFLSHPDTGWISSMAPPLLADWSQLAGLHYDPAHPWNQRYRRQLEIFVEGSRGNFGITHFILIDALNLCFELVGATKTYLSLDECPDAVRQAIEFAYDLNVAIQETFFAHVPLLDGGTCSNMVQWIPGRIVSESVDPFHMTSVKYFEHWGREPVERILGHFDGGVVHIHGNGRHLLEAVSTIRGLKAIYLGNDKGFPPAFEVLSDLQRRCGDVPLVVQVDFDRFVEAIQQHALPGGVFYNVTRVPDVAAANRMMEKVRAYRR